MWLYILVLVAVAAGEQRRSLSAPRKVTAKTVTSDSVEVSWRDPDLANRGGSKFTRLYVVKYQEDSGHANGSDTFETVRVRQKRVKLTRLTPNTKYEIWVRSVKNKKSSAWSKPVKVTTHEHEDNVYMVRNLTATPVSSDAILLSWLPPEQANKVVAYTILTQLANGNGRQQKDVASSAMLEYKVGHLRPHLLYSFRIQAMQKVGPHPISPAVLAQPFSDVPTGPPRDVTLQVIDARRLLVTWQPPAPNQRNGQIQGYNLRHKHSGARNGVIENVTIDSDTGEYSLPDMAVNETYMVQIAANTINGSGPYSNWETILVEESKNKTGVRNDIKGKEALLGTDGPPASINPTRRDLTPKPPSELKVVNNTGSSVFVKWTLPEATADCCPVVAYKIIITNYNASSEHEIVRGTTHVLLPGLVPRTLYGVKVSSMSMARESWPSEELLFVTEWAESPTIDFYQASTAILGGEANLTCKGKGHEAPTITWFMSPDPEVDGDPENLIQITDSKFDVAETIKITTSSESDTQTSTLQMYNITRAGERKYFCVAKNSHGQQQHRLTVTVYEAPRIITSHGATATVGGTARVGCEAYGRPVPNVSWAQITTGAIYNETYGSSNDVVYAMSILQESNHTRQSFLVIKDTSLRDQGFYLCIAQSEVGKAEVQVHLHVKVPPPGPVHKIQTIPLSPSRVSVSWLPPLSYNYNIAYYQVRYRKKRGGQPLVFNTTRVGTELYDLDHATEYLVGVTAGTEDSLGESGPEVDVLTLSNEGLQPANVSVKTLNTSIIQIDWEGPPNISPRNIRGYNVYTRREGEERTEKLFVKGSSSKQFLIGLGRDDTYYLKISTLMTWGYEAHSSWVRIEKRAEALVPPGKPLGVTALAHFSEVTLSWEPPATTQPGPLPVQSQIKGYKIMYGPVTDPVNVSRATTEAYKRLYLITGLEPSQVYMISIRAYNDIGDGEPVYTRTQTQALPPSMVQNASARPISSTEIHVQWEHPQKGHVTQYHIRYWRPGRKDKQSAWLAGNFQNYIAGSLRKNSNYRFEVIPYDGEMLGEAIIIFSYTYGDKPDGPPTNVSIRTLNSTTLVASWTPPDPEKANGVIIGYKLVLRSGEGSRMASFTVPGTEEAYTFSETPVSRLYKFRMAAITVNGTGVFSPWVEYAALGAYERPAVPQNLTVIETETSLTLQWRPPPFTGTPVHGYIVGYGQFIPEVYRHILSASQMGYSIKLLKPDSEYITSVRAFNHIGESPPTLRIVRTKSVPPRTTVLHAPVKLTVRPESPTSLLLSWVDPVLNEVQRVLDGRAYLIRFALYSGETYSYVNTTQQHHLLTDLYPATKYEVSVKVVRGSNSSTWSLPVVNSTHQIEYIIYLTSDPSLDTKFWVVMRTGKMEVKIMDIVAYTTYYFRLQARNKAGYGPLSQTVVYVPPSDERAVPTNLTVSGLYDNVSTTVRVSWSVPQEALDHITGFLVYYTSIGTGEPDWVVHSERGLDTFIDGLDHSTTYFFKVQARYSASNGPFSRIVTYTTSPEVLNPVATLDVDTDESENSSSVHLVDNVDSEETRPGNNNRERAKHIASNKAREGDNENNKEGAKDDGSNRNRAKDDGSNRSRATKDGGSNRNRAKDGDHKYKGDEDNSDRDKAKEYQSSSGERVHVKDGADRVYTNKDTTDRANVEDGAKNDNTTTDGAEGIDSSSRGAGVNNYEDGTRHDDGTKYRVKDQDKSGGARQDNGTQNRAKDNDSIGAGVFNPEDRAKQDNITQYRAKDNSSSGVDAMGVGDGIDSNKGDRGGFVTEGVQAGVDEGKGDSTGVSMTDRGVSMTDRGVSMTDRGGSMTDGGGSLTDRGGSMTDRGGSMTDSGGRITDSNGSITDNDGRITDSNSRIIDSDGRMIDNGDFITDSNGRYTDSVNSTPAESTTTTVNNVTSRSVIIAFYINNTTGTFNSSKANIYTTPSTVNSSFTDNAHSISTTANGSAQYSQNTTDNTGLHTESSGDQFSRNTDSTNDTTSSNNVDKRNENKARIASDNKPLNGVQEAAEYDRVYDVAFDKADNTGKDDMADNTGKNDMADNTGKDDMADNTGKDDMADNTGKDDKADNTGKDDMADNTGKDDMADNTGKDDMADNTGKDDMADNTGKDDMADNTGKDDNVDNTGKVENADNTEKDDSLDNSKKKGDNVEADERHHTAVYTKYDDNKDDNEYEDNKDDNEYDDIDDYSES